MIRNAASSTLALLVRILYGSAVMFVKLARGWWSDTFVRVVGRPHGGDPTRDVGVADCRWQSFCDLTESADENRHLHRQRSLCLFELILRRLLVCSGRRGRRLPVAIVLRFDRVGRREPSPTSSTLALLARILSR